MSIKQSILYNEPLEQIEGSEIMSARGARKKSMIPQITEEIKENRIARRGHKRRKTKQIALSNGRESLDEPRDVTTIKDADMRRKLV